VTDARVEKRDRRGGRFSNGLVDEFVRVFGAALFAGRERGLLGRALHSLAADASVEGGRRDSTGSRRHNRTQRSLHAGGPVAETAMVSRQLLSAAVGANIRIREGVFHRRQRMP
jgi:hypothetical protein